MPVWKTEDNFGELILFSTFIWVGVQTQATSLTQKCAYPLIHLDGWFSLVPFLNANDVLPVLRKPLIASYDASQPSCFFLPSPDPSVH